MIMQIDDMLLRFNSLLIINSLPPDHEQSKLQSLYFVLFHSNIYLCNKIFRLIETCHIYFVKLKHFTFILNFFVDHGIMQDYLIHIYNQINLLKKTLTRY